jgi:hypothetical protein
MMKFIVTHYQDLENWGNYKKSIRVLNIAGKIDLRRRPTIARVVIRIVIVPHYCADVGMESIRDNDRSSTHVIDALPPRASSSPKPWNSPLRLSIVDNRSCVSSGSLLAMSTPSNNERSTGKWFKQTKQKFRSVFSSKSPSRNLDALASDTSTNVPSLAGQARENSPSEGAHVIADRTGSGE